MWRLVDARPFAPGLKAGDVLASPDAHCKGECLVGCFTGSCWVADEPRDFRRGNGDHCDARKLAGGLGQGARLGDEREDVWVAAPSAGSREDGERERAWEGRDPAAAEDEFGGVDCVRPASLVELETGAVGEQVELMEFIPLLACVGEALVEDAGEVVAAGRYCGSGACQVRGTDDIDKSPRSSEGGGALGGGEPMINVAPEFAPAHLGKCVTENFVVAERLRQLKCTAGSAPGCLVIAGRREYEGEGSVGECELAPRRQLLEEVNGLARRCPRLLASARAPEGAGEFRSVSPSLSRSPIA